MVKAGLVFTIFLIPSLSCAADADSNALSLAEEKREFLQEKNQSVFLDARTGFAGSGIQLNADSDSTSVALAGSRSWDASSSEATSFHTLTFKLSSPIDKETKKGSFVTQAGIVNGTALEVAYSNARMANEDLPATVERRQQLANLAKGRCSDHPVDDDNAESCKALDEDGRKRYLSESEELELQDDFLYANMWLYGVAGSVGYNDLGYRDPVTFEKRSEDKVPWTLSAFLGLSPSAIPLYVGAGYEFKKEYKNSDTQILCQPGTSPSECFSSSFAPPKEKDKSVIFSVVRYQNAIQFSDKNEVPFGVEVKAAYDAANNTFGLGLPLYLFSDAKENLRGGVRLEWDSSKDELGVGVFVGAPFSLF